MAEEPLDVFYSCASADDEWRSELEKRLRPLERQGLIKGWHRTLIPPGADQQRETAQHLAHATVILVLLTSEYVASDACYAEMERALARSQVGEALLVSIVLKPVEFETLPVSALRPLPASGKAVSSWSSRKSAWDEIARGLRQVVERERADALFTAPNSPLDHPVWAQPALHRAREPATPVTRAPHQAPIGRRHPADSH